MSIELEGRLRKLERQNKILTFGLTGLVALCLMGQTTKPKPKKPEELTVSKLRLVDAQGKPRANFFVDGKEVYLILGQADGKTRMALRVTDGGKASMVLAGADGESRSSWECDADGTVRRVP